MRQNRELIAIVLLLLPAILLHACAPAAPAAEEPAMEEAAEPAEEEMEEPAAEEMEVEEVAEEPIEEVSPPIEVVYGEDKRFDLCSDCSFEADQLDPALQQMAGAVAVLVRPEALELEEDVVSINAYSLSERIELTYGQPLCPDQRFSQQPAPGFCTGFLINDRTLVTAGHCIPDQSSCDQTRFVFGFRSGTVKGELAPLSTENVFQCEELLTSQVSEGSGIDFALVMLDRSTDIPPIPMALDVSLTPGDELAVFGHPSGLPLKASIDGFVITFEEAWAYFIASLDTFAGSSGSPVIDLDTLEVVGLVRGGEDDYIPGGDNCYAVNVCALDASDCSGEAVMRIDVMTEMTASSTAP